MLSAATSTLSLSDVLSKVCQAALELTVGDAVSIFLIDDETGAARPMAAVDRSGSGDLTRFLKAPLALLDTPETRRATRALMRRKTPLLIGDAATSPLVNSWWVENFGLKSIVHYPLRVKDKIIGTLVVGSSTDGLTFPREEMDVLAAVAGQAAVIIENARLYEREQRQRRRSESLTTVLTAATSTPDLQEVLARVCEATLALTVGDGVSVFLVDDATGGSVPMMAAGRRQRGTLTKFLNAPPEATRDPPSLRFFRAVTGRKKPLFIKDAASSPFVGSWWVREFDVKSLVAYPLIAKGKTIGAMTVDTESNSVRFSREEVETLDAVSRQVAVIIENARLYERESRQRHRGERLTRILTAASATLSLRQACTRVCEAALEVTAGDTVSIFLHLDDSQGFRPVSALGRGTAEELKMFLKPPPEVQSSPGIRLFDRKLARRTKPYIIEDVAASPHGNKWWAENFRLKSLAYYPLRAQDKMIGFMAVAATAEKRRFSQEEVDTLAALAKQAAVIIENARLYERQQVQRQRAEGLVNVLTAAASTLSLRKVLIKLCQAVVDISVAERCSIYMMSEDGTRLEPEMSIGVGDARLWKKFRNPPRGVPSAPASQALFETIKRSEEPVVIEDAPSSPLLPRWWVKTFDLKSVVQYPLRVKDRTIGMMTVDSFRRPVRFPQDEIDTLAAIAKQAGVIIENARVYEREQQQRQRAEALVGVLTTAASNLGLNKVLVKICQTVVDISVGDRCSIFVVGEDGRLMPMMSLGIEDPEAWDRFRNARVLAGSKAASPDMRRFYGAVTKIENPVVIEDAASSPLIPRWWLKAFQVKSLVHYPLRIKDRTIGLMTIDAFRAPVQFGKEEIDTVAAIARQAAVVIENARLHEQLQKQAITDHITGLFNHRHIFARLEEEFARAERSGGSFAVMMMDMDKFKEINDTFGHLEGDEALRFIGQKLRETLRATDILGRYGGDEFMAILPDTTCEQAEEAGQRIMTMLAETPFHVETLDQTVPLAISIGFAAYPYHSKDKEELLMLADAALYEAKRLGGKRALPVNAPEAKAFTSQSLGFDLLQGLLNAIAYKDPYTRRHCEDNVRYVDLVADRLHLSADARESLRKAALLHDVGKIAIPDQTLLKPGPLDSDEWEVMQQHVRFGEMIVKGIAQISDAIEPVATHHERFDGNGYPRGLKGKRIPLLGRILAVVDAYSAMTLDRPYRKALTEEAAVEELRKGAGTQFDPDVVDAFLETLAAARKAERKVA